MNFIVGWFFQHCDVPWTLYVQFAVEPAIDVAVVLGTLDLPDLGKELFRPKGLRTGRHGRKGRKGSKAAFDLLDVDELVARNVPGGQEFRGRPFGSPTFWAFEITDVADRVAWTFFCIDGLTGIGYKSLLGIMEASKANCPQIGRMFRTDDYAAIVGTGPNFAAFGVDHLEWIHNLNSPFGHVCDILDGGSYAVTLEVEDGPIVPGNVTCAIGIYDYLSGTVVNNSGLVPMTFPERTMLACDAIVIGPGAVGPCVMSDGDHSELRHMKWLVTQISQE